MIDMMIVGNVLGKSGLSAVSVGGDVSNFLTFVAMGFSNAGQVLIARYIGARERHKLGKFVGTMSSFLISCAVFLSVVGLLFQKEILQVMNTPPEALEGALHYSGVCMAGLVFIYGYNIVSAILRGMGDSLIPMLLTCGGVCGMRVCWLLLSGKLWPGRLLVMLSCYPLTWVATSTLFVVYYISFTKRRGIPL